jgi:hypothetical protein
MPADQDRSLKVFISYASEDLKIVSEIVKFLHEQKIEAWFDRKNLQPGQEWEHEIAKGIKDADAVIACLSSVSVQKEGFVQVELKWVAKKTDEKPEGTIFLLPIKLDKCQPPSHMEKYQWLSLSDPDWQKKLLVSLRSRAKSLRVRLTTSGKGERSWPAEKAFQPISVKSNFFEKPMS